MKIDDFDDLQKFVDQTCEESSEIAGKASLHRITESLNEERSFLIKYARKASSSLTSSYEYRDAPKFFAQKARGTILSVDIRGSAKRAAKIGPKNTFVTMHVFIQAMLRLIVKSGGESIGLRRDGLLAVFGRFPFDKDDEINPLKKSCLKSITKAACCGDAMIQCTKKIINTSLNNAGIEGELKIGIGIESGQMVITKIGLEDAFEITAYGHCVNKAAHISNEKSNINKVLIGQKTKKIFPKGRTGRANIKKAGNDFYEVNYPEEFTLS